MHGAEFSLATGYCYGKSYRKIPKISPEAYIFQRPFLRGLFLEGPIFGGGLTEGFLRHRFGGLIFGGAYTWRGLFSEFYGILESALYKATILHTFLGTAKMI